MPLLRFFFRENDPNKAAESTSFLPSSDPGLRNANQRLTEFSSILDDNEVMEFMADLHIHSTFSDGKLTIAEVVDLYGKRGFGAIAITDHLCETKTLIGKAARLLDRTLTEKTFSHYQEILKQETERAWSLYQMVVIPGFELTKNAVSNHRSSHVLALGDVPFISANDDVVEIARKIRSHGGIAIAAHPVHTQVREKQTYHLWDRRAELTQEFDAWEVASGPHIFDEVLKSNLPKIASSDLHSAKQMTSWKTVFDCEKHPEAIFDSIRSQKITFRFYSALL